jgi:peptidoglycan/LPS O-acetylase OafA/YrhL
VKQADSITGDLRATGGTSVRLAGLDGLRAVAILLVIAYHATIRWSLPLPRGVKGFLAEGSFGVTIFFVLSGFLITHLLLGEERKTGSISLGRFYFRRAFRILPAAFCYLAMVSVLGALGRMTVAAGDVAASAGFVRNLTYRVFGPASTAHYWSLSIEEQFYLVWPVIFVVLRGRMRVHVTAAMVVAAPLWRMAAQRMGVGLDVYLSRTDLLYDSLAVGCLLAVLRADPAAGRFMRGRVMQHPLMLLAAVVGVVATGFYYHWLPRGLDAVRLSASYVAVAAGINYLVEGRKGVVGWMLGTGVMVWIGRLSYSLYLWQQLFILRDGSLGSSEFGTMGRDLALTGLMAVLSFVAVEGPFLRWRERMERHRQVVPDRSVTMTSALCTPPRPC